MVGGKVRERVGRNCTHIRTVDSDVLDHISIVWGYSKFNVISDR